MNDTCVDHVKAGAAEPIVRRLVDRIRQGELKPGQCIGSEVQLAEHNGISRMTVRRALSRLVAQGLIERRPGKGLFVGAEKRELVVDCFVPSLGYEQWVKVVRGANRADARQPLRLRIHDAHGRTDEHLGYLRRLVESSADGAIIAWLPHLAFAEEIYRLKQVGFPFVLVDASLDQLPVASVAADHFAGGYVVGSELVKLGHRRIAFVGDPRFQSLRLRLNGLRDAIADAGLPFHRDLVADLNIADPLSDWSEAITRVTRELMRRPNPPTALFYANDAAAAFGCRVLKEMGLGIPRDVSVVGFDNEALASLVVPRLATVEQPSEQLGSEAIEILLQQINARRRGEDVGEAVERLLPIRWIGRESAGPAPALQVESSVGR